MDGVEVQRLTVNAHFDFQPEFPERFDWSLVINRRQQELCELLAEAIIIRRDKWLSAGNVGVDPLIPGLQEALRLFAKDAVWRVMTQSKMPTNGPATKDVSENRSTERASRRASWPDPNKRQQEVARKLR